MTRATESKWRALIAEQERTGMKVREFAASRGITATTLYWWRSRLRRGPRSAHLVPVEIVEHDIEQSVARGESFELHIDGGLLLLRIPGGFDEAELRRLVRALRC
jgi:hypothetical protein